MSYAFYFLVTILILVFVHELGHFLAAKMMGMRTDVFAIGFGKRLLGWNRINGFSFGDLPEGFDTEGHTDYRICLLPLGGYVKIAGMIDESMDNNFVKEAPKQDEFRSKGMFAKLFVISAGVIMNFILAIAIFTGLNYFVGKQIYKTTTIGSVEKTGVAYEAGFRTGDKLLAINGNELQNWEDVYTKSLLENFGDDFTVKLQRDAQELEIKVDGGKIAEASAESFFLTPGQTKTIIGAVVEHTPAAKAGFKAGDIYLAINGRPVSDPTEIRNIILDNGRTEMDILVLRGEDSVSVAVTPGVDDRIGVQNQLKYMGEWVKKEFGLGESVALSFTNAQQNVTILFTVLSNLFTGDAKLGNTIGGPLKIAKFASYSADAGLAAFLGFVALLSLTLAIMNILPFPVLDGGHFVIILVEGIIRRELPVKIKIAIQNVGFFILMFLFIIIMYNDIINW